MHALNVFLCLIMSFIASYNNSVCAHCMCGMWFTHACMHDNVHVVHVLYMWTHQVKMGASARNDNLRKLRGKMAAYIWSSLIPSPLPVAILPLKMAEGRRLGTRLLVV